VIFTPLFNNCLLRNRNKRGKDYWATVALALLLFVLFDFIQFRDVSVVNSLDMTSPTLDLGYFQIVLPRSYAWFSEKALKQNPEHTILEILPFALTIVSALLGIWRRVLSMRYNLKQGYSRKLKLFVREKIKMIDEAEINLATVDRNGTLLPRLVNKNAQIVKRHRAIHEANARKKVI